MNGRRLLQRKRALAWIAATMILGGILGARLAGGDRRIFLPGETTGGHHQIEIDCLVCHDPFRGVKESACLDCHGERLAASNDSHPKSKFTDPRNADRLEHLDARLCVACHREHVPEATRPMGVTLPDDLCVHCHEDVASDRPSHAGLGFETCASAGCHNFHDNTALYEDFLLARAGEPETRAAPRVPTIAPAHETPRPVAVEEAASPPGLPRAAEATAEWAASAHARADVGCADCHRAATAGAEWIAKPSHEACATCHAGETAGWRRGKHGLRASRDLPPMRPALARLPMDPSAAERELGCASCHGAHAFDRRRAAEACLACHADEHSLAWQASPHARLWREELAGRAAPGSGVSCATCHLPRFVAREEGVDRVRVRHDPNHDLRPNEKMIRGVCLHCHGLAFAIDALADEGLVERNFLGRPSRHVESLDMAKRREAEHGAADPRAAKEGNP